MAAEAAPAEADVAAIILAAGRATRFGAGEATSKVYASLDGRALVAHAIAAAAASRASPVIVVTGHASHLAAAAFAHARPDTLVHNSSYRTGMASSLHAGLAAVPPPCVGALVLLGDMPLVAAATLDALISAFLAQPCDAVVPHHGGRPGNPVLLGRSLFAEAARLDGDEGARKLLRRADVRALSCDVDDAGIHADVDTAEALAAIAGRRAGA